MITKKLSAERGWANHGWLKSHHTFSFADYYDPQSLHFRALRVINDDYVEGSQGFGTHPHADMEIVTYVLEGQLEHKDSMKNGSIIRAGDVQYMSAGTGVTHSEFNPSPEETVHLLQIWILPRESDLRAKPRYDQKNFAREAKLNQLRTIVSPDGKDGSIAVRQDAWIHASILESAKTLEWTSPEGHGQWLHVITGELEVNGQSFKSGDSAAVEGEPTLRFKALTESEFLLFDLGAYPQ